MLFLPLPSPTDVKTMSNVSATSNGIVTNETKEVNRKGWLLKRTRFTNRWRLAWFEFKDGMLAYGDSEERLHKSINLAGAVIKQLEGSKPYSWTITPGDSDHSSHRRTFHFRARTEEEQREWMEAIYQVQSRPKEGGSNACVVQ